MNTLYKINAINLKSKVFGGLVSTIVGLSLLTHIFTLERAQNLFVEYDNHFFIILASAFSLIYSFWLISCYPSFDIRISRITYTMLGFATLTIIHVAIDRSADSKYYVLVFSLSIYYLALSHILSRLKIKRRLSLIFLTISIIHLLFYFFKIKAFASTRFLEGMININSGVNLNFLVSSVPFIICIAIEHLKSKSKIITWVCVALSLLYTLIIFTNQSRAAWLALCASILYILVNIGKPLMHKLISPINGKLFRIAGCSIAFLLAIVVLHSVHTAKDGGSNSGRLLIYKVSKKMGSISPVWGLGIGEFESQYNNFQSVYIANSGTVEDKKFAGNSFYAFNEFLQLFIEMGIIGLAIVLYLIYLLFKDESKNFTMLGAKASLLSVFICSLFSYPLHTLSIVVQCVFFIALIASESPKERTIFLPAICKTAPLFFVTLISIWSIKYEVTRLQLLKEWERAAGLAFNNNFEKANLKYRQIYPQLRSNGQFLFNYGSEQAIAGLYPQSIINLEAAKTKYPNYSLYIYLGESYAKVSDYKKSEEALRFAINMYPSKYLAKFLLLKLYEKNSDKKKMKKMANDILKSSVKIPSITIIEYKDYARKVLSK